MWVPDKETIYGETTEAKKEGANLKFPIKLSVRHRAERFNLKFFPEASLEFYPLADAILIKVVSLGWWTPRGNFLHS